MSNISTVHQLFDEADWNYDTLKLLLEQDSSSVNETDDTCLAPLHRLLMNDKCSIETVKLLLQHGADVNLIHRCGSSPLMIALSLTRDKSIIKEILDRGVNHKKLLENDDYVICLAFFYRNSVEVIQMLLDAGFQLTGCHSHSSIFHCAIKGNGTPINSDLLKLLLEKCKLNVNMNTINRYGESLLCIAFSRGCDVQVIKLLLSAGCSLNACKKHSSPWMCATSYSIMLTLDIAKELVQRGANRNCINDVGEGPLQCALKYGGYEVDAIKLLLDRQTTDIKDLRSIWGETILHAALSNPRVQPKIVKLLIEKGAEVNVIDRYNDTPLHLAVRNSNYKQSIVNILIKSGASVNTENKSHQTPLHLAVDFKLESHALHVLLSAGARISAGSHWNRDSLQWALEAYDLFCYKNFLDCCKMLLKYSVLENPDINIEDLFLNNWSDTDVSAFTSQCTLEIQRMKSINIGQDCTLYHFISKCFRLEAGDGDYLESNYYDLNQLLKVLSENTFPLYLDAVASNIGRETLETKLQSTKVYTVISSPDTLLVQEKVFLTYESVIKIAEFLISDEDVLRLILAFNK